MKEESIVDGMKTFESNANVIKLLNHIEPYISKRLAIMFKKGNEITDEMKVHDINSQHLYYDIFTKELVFGNGVRIKLSDIVKMDKYTAGTESRFSIHYTVNRELFSVGIQNII